MKLKQATQLGVIGMIIQLVVTASYILFLLIGESIWYLQIYFTILTLIADAFLFTFFITLYKKQK